MHTDCFFKSLTHANSLGNGNCQRTSWKDDSSWIKFIRFEFLESKKKYLEYISDAIQNKQSSIDTQQQKYSRKLWIWKFLLNN